MIRPSVPALLAFVAMACGCATQELDKLRAENTSLREENERLRAGKPEPELTSIRSFTVGLAASERDFDDAAFTKMVREYLDGASQKKSVRVVRESDPRQVQKIRGMLIQQYLAAEEVPILISNLSFKLQDAKHVFKIGGQVVPVEGTNLARTGGEAVNATYSAELGAVMRRDSRGQYSVEYEEVGGGKGRVQIRIRDVDILDTEERPRAERQGDLSFNWRLNLEKIEVFRVENFQGDVGRFLADMRYSAVHSSIGNYQTLRDFVFLFGYGRYTTGLVNQIRTPAQITRVEVRELDDAQFEKLTGRLSEKELIEISGEEKWISCKFVDFESGDKVWERPSSVNFPFLTRQIDEQKKQVFYLKFNSSGTFFVGDFER